MEGFDRESVKIHLKGCPVRADASNLPPPEYPAFRALVVSEVFEQMQVRIVLFNLQSEIAVCTTAPTHRPACPTSQMDLLDIGEGRDPNYRYIWICMDLFTKHVWLRPLPKKESLLVAREVGGRCACPTLPAFQPSTPRPHFHT